MSSPRVRSALEGTAGCCVRHIRSQGEPPGPPKAARSQKDQKAPQAFLGRHDLLTDLCCFQSSPLGMRIAIKGLIIRGVQRNGTMPVSLRGVTDKETRHRTSLYK